MCGKCELLIETALSSKIPLRQEFLVPRFLVSCADYLALAIWHWLFGTGYSALAIRHWLFGTGYLALAIWHW
jgi:hypothetical protein